MKTILIILVILQTTLAFSQNKKNKDKNAILKMSGCFEVSFNFSETFKFTDDSTYIKSPNKIANALEWAELVKNNDNEIMIQHILQMGNDSNAYIIKHWRQDWLYQNQNLLSYIKDNEWRSETLKHKDVRGQWTQKVLQVDDSPRYEGSATWIHVDGKSFWESRVNAPLPRREYTIRNDYNVLNRGNRVEITDNGWLHDQDNLKIIKKDSLPDVIKAREVGLNYYVKVDDKQCIYAKKWWNNEKNKWAIIRSAWDQIYQSNQIVNLESTVNNKRIYEYLFSEEYRNVESVNSILYQFLK